MRHIQCWCDDCGEPFLGGTKNALRCPTCKDIYTTNLQKDRQRRKRLAKKYGYNGETVEEQINARLSKGSAGSKS